MTTHSPYVVDTVMKAMINAMSDHMRTRTENDLFLDSYRVMAEAALDAIDSLYESEADEPVEYAGIEGGL